MWLYLQLCFFDGFFITKFIVLFFYFQLPSCLDPYILHTFKQLKTLRFKGLHFAFLQSNSLLTNLERWLIILNYFFSREYAGEKTSYVPSECVGLRETYFNCKRDQVASAASGSSARNGLDDLPPSTNS